MEAGVQKEGEDQGEGLVPAQTQRQQRERDEHTCWSSLASHSTHLPTLVTHEKPIRTSAVQRSLPATEAGHPALCCLLWDCNVTLASRLIWLRANTEGTEMISTQKLLCNIRNHLITVQVVIFKLFYFLSPIMSVCVKKKTEMCPSGMSQRAEGWCGHFVYCRSNKQSSRWCWQLMLTARFCLLFYRKIIFT